MRAAYLLLLVVEVAVIVTHASTTYTVTDTSAYRDAFDLVDLNVDGLFDEQEFIKFRDMMESSKRSRLNELFVAFDGNNDRALTQSEFNTGLDANEEFFASLRLDMLTEARVARMKEAMDRRAQAIGQQPAQAGPTVAMLGGKCKMQVSQTPLDRLVLGQTVNFEIVISSSSATATCKNVILNLVFSKSIHYVANSVVFVDPLKGHQNDAINSDQTLYIPILPLSTHGFIFAIGNLAVNKRQVIQMQVKLCGDPGTVYSSLVSAVKDFIVLVDLHTETRHSPQYAKCFDDCAQQHGGCDSHTTCTPCTSTELTRAQRQAYCSGDQGVVCSSCPFEKGDGKNCHNHQEACGVGTPCYPASLSCHQGRCIVNVCLEGYCSPYATCTPQSDTTATCACTSGYHGDGVGGNGCVPN